jgi:AraC family transcriptional regulator of adaptative response / DNA-3-methyladenine glycosylase II
MRLAYRPPLAWQSLLAFLRLRAIPGVECVEGNTYRRTIEVDGEIGIIEVRPAEDPYLAVRIELPATARLAQVIEGVRRVFDLSADPVRIAEDLGSDPALKPLVRAVPGLRVPGAWDPFELTVRAVLGQQISVKAATTIAGRIARSFGKPLDGDRTNGLTHVFPTAEALLHADLRSVGLTAARVQAVRNVALAACKQELPRDAASGLEPAIEALKEIGGIGTWTAHYVAMRAFGEPDAFPQGDLGLRRALSRGGKLISTTELDRMAERWRPWRAYAAIYLWLGKS